MVNKHKSHSPALRTRRSKILKKLDNFNFGKSARDSSKAVTVQLDQLDTDIVDEPTLSMDRVPDTASEPSITPNDDAVSELETGENLSSSDSKDEGVDPVGPDDVFSQVVG